MNSRKLLPAAIAAGAAATALALPAAASASIASAPAAASSPAAEVGSGGAISVAAKPKTGSYRIGLSFTQKKESTQSFKASRTGTVQLRVTAKHFNHRVDLRIVTCKDRVALTDFQQIKKLKGGKYYTLKDNGKAKRIKKGTCFKVQAKRSPAGWVKGNVRY